MKNRLVYGPLGLQGIGKRPMIQGSGFVATADISGSYSLLSTETGRTQTAQKPKRVQKSSNDY